MNDLGIVIVVIAGYRDHFDILIVYQIFGAIV